MMPEQRIVVFTEEMEAQLRAVLEIEGVAEIPDYDGWTADEILRFGPVGQERIEAFVAEAQRCPRRAIEFLSQWKLRSAITKH